MQQVRATTDASGKLAIIQNVATNMSIKIHFTKEKCVFTQKSFVK